MTDELFLMAFCCELRLYAFTRVFEIFWLCQDKNNIIPNKTVIFLLPPPACHLVRKLKSDAVKNILQGKFL